MAIADYYDGLDQLPEGAFKISPSSVENFFSDKVTWYSENLLGAAKKFTGSTATVLGTVCHHCAEVVANSMIEKKPHDSDKLAEEVTEYIAQYADNDDYDTSKIESLWKNMAEMLIKDFVLTANTVATENYISHELIPGVWVGGTYDAITSSDPTATWDDVLQGKNVGTLTVRDYKTASKLPSSFSYKYKLQAYTYAYILHQKGIKVNEVELCYAVQPTKTIGVRTKNFKLPFDDNAYNFIEGILHVIADSVQCFRDWPDLRYLLMHDYRQKINDIPRPSTEAPEEVKEYSL
jgi:hypothetical protein